MTSEALARAESLIATIPDFPSPGVLFRDISPLLADAAALRTVVDAVIAPHATRGRLRDAFGLLERKLTENPARKHGNIPL